MVFKVEEKDSAYFINGLRCQCLEGVVDSVSALAYERSSSTEIEFTSADGKYKLSLDGIIPIFNGQEIEVFHNSQYVRSESMSGNMDTVFVFAYDPLQHRIGSDVERVLKYSLECQAIARKILEKLD